MNAVQNALTDEQFAAVAQLVHNGAGLVVAPGKQLMVASRLGSLLRRTGDRHVDAYLTRVRREPAEMRRLIDAMTTNHTGFYRESHHFTHFEAQMRPDLLARIGDGQPVRLWSAGCSTGAEPFSLAMTMLGPDRAAGARLAQADLRILATDISDASLATARTGECAAADVDAVPPGLHKAWCRMAAERCTIDPVAAGLVRFRSLNLIEAWPVRCMFDAIFCRNVMIYFDTPTKEALMLRLARHLRADGYLYIGHSERVTGPAAALLQPVGNTIYRKVAS